MAAGPQPKSARWRRTAAMVGLVAVLAVPALRRDPPDGFPLSTYPMFSSPRGREVGVATAVGIDAAGEAHRLDPDVIGGTGEVMLAATTVRRAVDEGQDELGRLCREVAARLVDEADLVAVELRTETHDAVAWFDGDREPAATTTHHRCEIDP